MFKGICILQRTLLTTPGIDLKACIQNNWQAQTETELPVTIHTRHNESALPSSHQTDRL